MPQNILHELKTGKGVYPVENDGTYYFRWFAKKTEINLKNENSLIYIRGMAAVPCTVKIVTSSNTFNFKIDKEKIVDLPIVLNNNHSSTISFCFSDSLPTTIDRRELSFKCIAIYKGCKCNNETERQTSINGIPTGQVSTIFASGWLRMCVQRENAQLKVSGILVPPLTRREYPQLTINNIHAENLNYKLTNQEYTYLPNCAFEGHLDLSQFGHADKLTFSSRYPSDGAPATSPYHNWVFPLHESGIPTPDEANLVRIGANSKDWYLFSGMTFVENLERACAAFLKKPLGEATVLDWGCGCGRLARHLIPPKCHRLCGADIDPQNLDWCKKNIPHAEFSLVKPTPPMPFEDNSFDVIYAHSVMTHLSEPDQFLWLNEIARILVPEGIAILTVMGNYSAAIERFSESKQYVQLQKTGFLDMGWQNDGVDVQQPGFYRRIFHTVDYILQKWSIILEVVSVIEGFSDHQAAIIMKKGSLDGK